MKTAKIDQHIEAVFLKRELEHISDQERKSGRDALLRSKTQGPTDRRGLIVQTDRMESISSCQEGVSPFSTADVQDPGPGKPGFYFFKNLHDKVGRLRRRPTVLSGLIGLREVAPLSCVEIHENKFTWNSSDGQVVCKTIDTRSASD